MFTGLMAFFLLSSAAFSMTVKRKLVKKGVVVVNTDGESVSKGDKICIFGKKGKKIACGKVRRLKGGSAFVKVPKKRIKRIKKGQTASLDGAASTSLAGGVSSDSNYASTRNDKDFSFLTFLGGSISPAFNATGPKYTPAGAATGEQYWEPGDAKGLGAFLGLELLYNPIGLAAGFRYFAVHEAWRINMDYTAPADATFVSLVQTQSSMGFWLDYLYAIDLSGSKFSLGLGLDIDMSTVESEALQRDDNDSSVNNVLMQASSSLTAIGLRIPLRYDIDLGGMDFFIRTTVVVGVSGEAALSAKDTSDTNVSNATPEKYNEDYAAALDHKPGLGIMGALGISFSF